MKPPFAAIVDASAQLRRAWARELLRAGVEVLTAGDGASLARSLQGRSCDIAFVGPVVVGEPLISLPARLVVLEDATVPEELFASPRVVAVLPRSDAPPRGLAALVRSAAAGASAPLAPRASSVKLPADFVASASLTRELVRELGVAAASPFPVLLAGEPGVGKATLARAILGDRFTRVGPSLDADLLASALSGAPDALLVDRVDDLTPDAQAVLAGWLGSAAGSRAKVVALARPSARERSNGALDRPLARAFARHMLDVPSLRERPDDIPVMAAVFAKSLCDRLGVPPKRFSPNVLRALRAEPWPGNVPELAAAVDAAVLLAEARDRIVRSDFAVLRRAERPAGQGPLRELEELPPWASLKSDVVAAVTRAYLEEVITRARGNQSQAARMAGLDPANYRRLDRSIPARIGDAASTAAVLAEVVRRLEGSRRD